MATGICYTQSGNVKRYETDQWHGFATTGKPVLSAYGLPINDYNSVTWIFNSNYNKNDPVVLNNTYFNHSMNKTLFTITKEPSSTSYKYEVSYTYFIGDNYINDFKQHIIDNFNIQTKQNIDDYNLTYYNPNILTTYETSYTIIQSPYIFNSIKVYYHNIGNYINTIKSPTFDGDDFNGFIIYKPKPLKLFNISSVLFSPVVYINDDTNEKIFNNEIKIQSLWTLPIPKFDVIFTTEYNNETYKYTHKDYKFSNNPPFQDLNIKVSDNKKLGNSFMVTLPPIVINEDNGKTIEYNGTNLPNLKNFTSNLDSITLSNGKILWAQTNYMYELVVKGSFQKSYEIIKYDTNYVLHQINPISYVQLFIKDLPDYYLINVNYERNINDPINASNVSIIWNVKSYKNGKILQSYIPGGIIDDLNFSIEFNFSVINYAYRENEIINKSSTEEGKFSADINVSYPLNNLYDFTSDLDYEGNGYDYVASIEQFTYPNKSHSGIEIKWK